MDWINDSVMRDAERFLWASGRVLEQRRFERLFGGGGAPGVLAALEAYRAQDGGYAYGLEPDVRGPASQPIAVPSALRALEEAGELREERVRGICDWLSGVTASDGGVPAVLPTLRDYPRPPWLPVSDDPPGDLLTTGQITGPLLRAGIRHPWLEGATEFCRGAVEGLDRTHPYEAEAAVDFLDGVPDRPWALRQADRLGTLVRDQRIVLLDPDDADRTPVPEGYAPGEHHMAYDYAETPGSVARAWFSDAEMERALRYLLEQQQKDGGWPLRWALWSATTEVESRPGVTLAALSTLRAYGSGGS